MQKENDCIKFVKGVNFELIDSLKNNGTKYLLLFDDSCEEVCSSEEFVKIATVGRHRGLSTIYIKNNLFHKSTLGRDIELQTTHIALFKSPRDVMQINTLSIQLGLGSSLVDWYRDATLVLFVHLLIDLSPRTDDRLHYCTNSGKVPSKFYVPESLKHLPISAQNFSILHAFQSFSRKCKIHFLQSCPKDFIRFLSECIVNILKGNLQNVKRHHVIKYKRELHLLFLKRFIWKQRRDLLTSERGLQLVDTITPFVIYHLS